MKIIPKEGYCLVKRRKLKTTIELPEGSYGDNPELEIVEITNKEGEQQYNIGDVVFIMLQEHAVIKGRTKEDDMILIPIKTIAAKLER